MRKKKILASIALLQSSLLSCLPICAAQTFEFFQPTILMEGMMPTVKVGSQNFRMLTSLTAPTNIFWSTNCTNPLYNGYDAGPCNGYPLYLDPNFNEATYNAGPNSTYLSNVTIGGYSTQATLINMREICLTGFGYMVGSACLNSSTSYVGWNVTVDAWLYDY